MCASRRASSRGRGVVGGDGVAVRAMSRTIRERMGHRRSASPGLGRARSAVTGQRILSGVKLGIVLPQGFMGEYAGWDPADAWRRTAAVARLAEDLGFDSVWVYDHVGTFGELRDEP